MWRPERAAQRRLRESLASGCASQVEGEFLADACGRECWRLRVRSEMIKDLANDDSFADQRDQLAPSAAVGALENVQCKDAFQQLGPRCALRARLTRRSGVESSRAG